MDNRLRYLALLRCFASAARHQSYTRAADELAISQAAVSQQIRNLEQQLAVKLFSRVGRNMRLTRQGKTLYEYVTRAFELVSQGFDRIQAEPQEGVLTVTAAPSFSSIWLVPRLWRFASLFPDITVRVLASEQLEDLRHSDVDVAIRQADHIDTDMHHETLLVDPVYPYCSPGLPAHMPLNKPEDLAACGLVESTNPDRFSWKHWFQIAGVEIKADLLNWIEVNTQEMGINAVIGGHGACLVTSCMATDLVERGVLIKPFDIAIHPGVRFSLLYDPDSPKFARVKLFADWLRKEILGQR